MKENNNDININDSNVMKVLLIIIVIMKIWK